MDIPRALFPCLAWFGASCGSTTATVPAAQVADSGAHYVPATSWRTAEPQAVGIDPARVRSMSRDLSSRRFGAIQGVALVRYGWLVLEEYHGWTASAPHTMQSVTKSVTSLLYGIATDGGLLPGGSVDRPVLDLFSRYPSIENTDSRKRALTMRHLLTMRTSMDFWEQPYAGSPLATLNQSLGDWSKYILDRPMTGDPGSGWAYNSGAAILVGSAIRELTGEQADVFARHALFAPIGITGETWYRSPFDALPHTGGGLGLKLVDLARLGYLVLRHGRWGDAQVVPRAWMDSSTHAVTRGPPVFFSEFGAGYGRFWWLFPERRGGNDEGIIAASGAGGQWLFVVPSLDLVVAIVADNGNGLDFLYDDVLPAVRGP